MIYTVIFTNYQNKIVSEVTQAPPDWRKAYEEIKQEFGSVLAVVPGNQPVYTEGVLREREKE